VSISFVIQSAAVPLQRARFTKTGQCYTPGKTREWKRLVAQSCALAMQENGLRIIETPVTMTCAFAFTPPKSWTVAKKHAAIEGDLHHSVKPDISNLVKAVEDALNGVAYVDDAQIVELHAFKFYDEVASVHVQVEPYVEDELPELIN